MPLDTRVISVNVRTPIVTLAAIDGLASLVGPEPVLAQRPPTPVTIVSPLPLPVSGTVGIVGHLVPVS
jgi:hypothetical protein